MLNPEVAKEQLKAVTLLDWKERFEARVQTLPEPLRVISHNLFLAVWGSKDPLSFAYHDGVLDADWIMDEPIKDDFEEDEINDFEDDIDTLFDDGDENADSNSDAEKERLSRHEGYQLALEQLTRLSAADRLLLFTAWFPGLENHVARAWKIWERLSYQTGYERKAFRSVSAANEPKSARQLWVVALVYAVGPYTGQSLAWFAAWASYLPTGSTHLGLLFAEAIESAAHPDGTVGAGLPPLTEAEIAEGDEVFDILLASARGEHEIGAFGGHVCRALFVADRPEGWTFLEKMLLAAQRQEGLRQVILETVDETHPVAFVRMLRLILDNDLVRFSAVVRAVNVWFGFGYEAMNPRAVKATLTQALTYLEDEAKRQHAVQLGDGNALYLALWAQAVRDADAAIAPATEVLQDPVIARRYAAIHFLSELGLPVARQALLPALDDSSIECAWCAFEGMAALPSDLVPDMFERLERFAERFADKEAREIESPVWEWQLLRVSVDEIGRRLANCLNDRSPLRLTPYLKLMSSYYRGMAIDKMVARKDDEPGVRQLMFTFMEDKDSTVYSTALAALEKMHITPLEAVGVEALLKRSGTGIRRAAVALLLTQPDTDALATSSRLLTATNAAQRSGGLAMLEQLTEAGRSIAICRAAAQEFQASKHKKSEGDLRILQKLLDEQRVEATLDDGLGLFDPAQLTASRPVRALPVAFVTPAAIACLRSLDAWIEAHRETPLQINTYAGTEEKLLGNVGYWFPQPPISNPLHPVPAYQQNRPQNHDTDAEGRPVPPLNTLWETWYESRPAELRDADGMELLRAVAAGAIHNLHSYSWQNTKTPGWLSKIFETLYGDARKIEYRHASLVLNVLRWLLMAHPPANGVDFMLDAIEATFAQVPLEEVVAMYERMDKKRAEAERSGKQFHIWESEHVEWQNNNTLMTWLFEARTLRYRSPELWTDAHHVRLFHLLRWLDRPVHEPTPTIPGIPDERLALIPRHRPVLIETLMAYGEDPANRNSDGATEADVMDHLIGPRLANHYGYVDSDLRDISGRSLPAWAERFSYLRPMIDRVRARVVEVEFERTERRTAATETAALLRYSGGISTLVRALALLGKEPFLRSANGETRVGIYSHLVRTSFPDRDDTPEFFAAQVGAILRSPGGEQKLLDLAMFAPQWATFVEATLGWPQLTEAVWWIHAHTKDAQWNVPEDIKEEWAAQAAERTPLDAESLVDGAVDVAWFHRVYRALGPERWQQLDASAKFASSTGGQKRAQLYADAMLGRSDRAQLLERIHDKRNQDALRALGLLPLPPGDTEKREADILERYRVAQEFIRTCRQFGPQRQVSEKRAAALMLENLARTAGYADPARLEWAMEAKAVADLAKGPVSVTVAETLFTLSINPLGKPELAITKNDKPLKSVPAAAKKDPAVLELQERKKEIERQSNRMRLSLERAMCRGDRFHATELPQLLAHPVLAPLLRSVLFLIEDDIEDDPDGTGLPLARKRLGYPLPFGRALQTITGEEIKLTPDMTVRIAHSFDLLHTGIWEEWQRDCFLRERVQPFKQVFRELYVLTESEADQRNISHRYDGHQLNPRQALATLGSRGWVSSAEEGVRRTFHDAHLTACLTFFEGYTTPAEVEGLTIDGVYFTRRGEWEPLPLTQVPPRIFSEAMRDVDLVVSVAHQGGVDPEASASTVEMRTTLLRESLRLLKISNVRFQSQHVLIDGKLGTYSIHMGSAVVHRQPGGALCIVPVHSQHRGRLFLPFADDDPKTAELISKVLLLANDTQIKDPIILEQILGRA